MHFLKVILFSPLQARIFKVKLWLAEVRSCTSFHFGTCGTEFCTSALGQLDWWIYFHWKFGIRG